MLPMGIDQGHMRSSGQVSRAYAGRSFDGKKLRVCMGASSVQSQLKYTVKSCKIAILAAMRTFGSFMLNITLNARCGVLVQSFPDWKNSLREGRIWNQTTTVVRNWLESCWKANLLQFHQIWVCLPIELHFCITSLPISPRSITWGGGARFGP